MAAPMDVNTEKSIETNLLTNLLLPSSQQNTNEGTNTEPGIDTPIRPGRTKKRGNPDSPEDLPGTARQVTRQIRRRNSVGDLSSLTSKKTPGFRKTIADKVVEALTSPEVLDQIIPVITEKLCESIELSLNKTIQTIVKSTVEEHIAPMTETIKKQEEKIAEQRQMIAVQAANHLSLNKIVVENLHRLDDYNSEIGDLYQKIGLLENRLENQEQYSRRTSLRFHNIQVPVDRYGKVMHPVNTDDLILDVCNKKLDLGIQKSDISRSHVIGKVRNGKSQVIVRFISYRNREKVFSAKKGLKGDPSKIFITENLTTHRTNLVKELADLKYRHSIHAYWTNDGRIYVKKTEASMKQLILNHDDIRDLLRNNDTDEGTGNNTDAQDENNQGVKDHD
ncbi:unnamed protein product [Mytilus coruscus]|uniref:Zinc finger DNA binding protein n=1 Tax=Mytilus coruscus TaxID=42192 RepID=A0A6J8ALI5_MYTCO|nr:unnamed protein product [Mytilus coruscus]